MELLSLRNDEAEAEAETDAARQMQMVLFSHASNLEDAKTICDSLD
jgi:hypothetical protein